MIGPDFSPGLRIWFRHQVAERRHVAMLDTCRRSATRYNPARDLGLKPKALTCRRSATRNNPARDCATRADVSPALKDNELGRF